MLEEIVVRTRVGWGWGEGVVCGVVETCGVVWVVTDSFCVDGGGW